MNSFLPWQGRVYSLDGTYGTTPDGRKYVPIEEATDIYTPNGKWKNGLFGFNCRHYMVEYKDGYRFPMLTLETEKEQQDHHQATLYGKTGASLAYRGCYGKGHKP